MTPKDFADRVAGVAALAEPVRRELYLYVAAQPEPVSRDQAAAGVTVARHTAKFHLDKLVEQGLLDTEFRRLSGRRGPGAGRPAKLYRRAAGEVAVSLPDRRYDLAGQLMAQAIEDSVRSGRPVLDALGEAAAAFGATLGDLATPGADATPGPDVTVSPGAPREVARRVLAACGYEPHLHDDTITLRNCPFHALVTEHTALVCGMNLALVQAVTERLGGDLTARLDPGEGRCCVVVVAG
jgi:predicted ArsR family transcriptional regulator